MNRENLLEVLKYNKEILKIIEKIKDENSEKNSEYIKLDYLYTKYFEACIIIEQICSDKKIFY